MSNDAASETAIHRFSEKEDLESHEWGKFRRALREKYRFYIMNPAAKRGVEYSLWVREDGYEYPALTSNTGGFPTFCSRSTTIGDGIQPTEPFLDLVAYGTHEALSFMPSVYFESHGDKFHDLAESLYDGKIREYEVWAAQILIRWMTLGETQMPEVDPLVAWADKHTEFNVEEGVNARE